MIISCPSCATRYDLAADRLSARGTMVRCRTCGHNWTEGRAVEIIDVTPRYEPAEAYDPDPEVARLIEAARAARANFERLRRRRRKAARGWVCLAAGIAAPFIAVGLFPETVVRSAPAAASLYERAGIKVNIYGLEVRRVQQSHMVVGGARVLAIKGEIVNVSNSERKVPALRFGLRDPQSKEVYGWVVDSPVRPLRAGEATSFTTRVASPPETAENIEIRFARIGEIGSNPAP